MSFQISHDGLALVRSHLGAGSAALEATADSHPGGPVDAGAMSDVVNEVVLELLAAAAQTSHALQAGATVVGEHSLDHGRTDAAVAGHVGRPRAE